MVDALEGGGEAEWDDHQEYGNQCIYELFQMSRSDHRKYTGNVAPLFERASRAIPHVRLMNRAIRQRDRSTAIQCGRAAVSEMSGSEHRTPPAEKPAAVVKAAAVVKTAAVVKPAVVVKSAARVVAPTVRHRKPAAKRVPALKSKAARA